jgi:hypothetical protein
MEKDKSIPIVLVATFYLVCYLLLFSSEITLQIAVLLFCLSPIVILCMVVAVLKQENKSRNTFDDYFYEDMDERRM